MLFIMGALKIELRHIIRSTEIHKNYQVDGLQLYQGKLEKVLIAITGIRKDIASRRNNREPEDKRSSYFNTK